MFAGHGMVHNGAQTVLVNELDPKTGYYRLLLVEQVMRAMSNNFKCSFHLAFLPCCREIYNKDKHCNCFGPTKEKATEFFNAKNEAMNAALKIEDKDKAELAALRLKVMELEAKMSA